MHHNSTKVSKLYIKGKKEMETRSNKVIAAMAVDKEGRNDASPSEQASKQASKPAKCVAHNYSASQRSVTHTHTHTPCLIPNSQSPGLQLRRPKGIKQACYNSRRRCSSSKHPTAAWRFYSTKNNQQRTIHSFMQREQWISRENK